MLTILPGGRPDPIDPDDLARKAEVLAQQARAYELRVESDATRRNYESDWRQFSGWCHSHGLEPLPASPETVRAYLTDHAAKHRPATLQRRLVAITRYHRAAGHEPPTQTDAVRDLLRGIKRKEGTRPNRKEPILLNDLAQMVQFVRQFAPNSLWAYRDRALLLLGWVGAFRRSELVALNVEDVRQVEGGLEVLVRQSKTDQEGRGKVKAIKYGRDADVCAVIAYREWIEVSGIERGPVFRGINQWDQLADQRLSDRSVARIVKDLSERIGLDPRQRSGHSLRSGLATTAHRAGVPARDIALTTGHRNLQSLDAYIREGDVWTQNAAKEAGY